MSGFAGIGWRRPRGAALRYCVKVSIASLAGYLLSLGGLQYAVYGAFSAALVVGASRGEDVGSAMNRAWGSVAGMVIGIAASHLAPHPGIAVAIAIGLTAYVCMGCGWGQAAARIGASMSAVTILAHSQDALEYSMMRVGNTVIGIAAGLAVSYFVLPVRGRDMLGANIERALGAVARLLAALADGAQSVEPARYSAVFEALVALQKTLADARKEIGGDFEALRDRAREVAVVCVGALSAALAHAELGAQARDHAEVVALREQAASLARRAQADAGASPVQAAVPRPFPADAIDEVALRGFAHGLRRVDESLRAIGH
jgi:uncharacterized membrane protein YccC